MKEESNGKYIWKDFDTSTCGYQTNYSYYIDSSSSSLWKSTTVLLLEET
jgi:hypothetical protein